MINGYYLWDDVSETIMFLPKYKFDLGNDGFARKHLAFRKFDDCKELAARRLKDKIQKLKEETERTQLRLKYIESMPIEKVGECPNSFCL